MPRKKVIEKKSPDPVKVEETPKEEVANGSIEPRRYKGVEIIKFIDENSAAYHIQLDNGTSTWVPKNEVK